MIEVHLRRVAAHAGDLVAVDALLGAVEGRRLAVALEHGLGEQRHLLGGSGEGFEQRGFGRREIAEYGKTETMNLQKPEMDLAEQFIRQLTARFEPEQYKDEYQQRVLDLIETKRAGQVVAGQPPKPKLAPVIDLMEALKKSIAERGAPAAVPGLVEAEKKKAPKSASAADAKPARRRKTG